MQCPNGDGQLISHTTHGENNLTVQYSTCPTCRGYWMESFAANFIKLPSRGDEAPPRVEAGAPPSCPVCKKNLDRATGENIPDTVWVYRCPDGHGYFFPAGQLAAFKQAQQTKIAYHKLWNLPIPSVASVLLAGFLVLVLTGGIVGGLTALQNRQVTTSQAKELLTGQHAYVIPQTQQVLITAQTQQDIVLTVHIPTLNNFASVLGSQDHRIHTMVVQHVPAGSYAYYFTWDSAGGTIRSETFTFVMPQ